MLFLITGTPGAGKTSHTLWDFLHDDTLKDRPKFATHINGFDYDAHGITKIDNINDWESLPDGSAILVDEADQFLPVKGREVPDFVRALARHRHRGFDFWIITQQGSMINHFARGLIESHIHYVRGFGEETVSKYRWETYQSNPDNPVAKKRAQRARIKVNKQVFDLYTSATVNTRKREYPWKWYAMLAAVPVAAIIAFFVVKAMLFKESPPSPITPAAVSSAPVALNSGLFNTPMPEKRGLESKDFVPRIPFDPSSSPAYDHLTTPTDFPRISACISSRKGCHCYTQQATPAYVPSAICEAMVHQAWFDRWKSGRQAEGSISPATSVSHSVESSEASEATIFGHREQTWPDT